MAWQRLALVVEGRHAEALCDALEAGGAVSTEISDADAGTAREQALFGEPGADADLWPRCRVSASATSRRPVRPGSREAIGGWLPSFVCLRTMVNSCTASLEKADNFRKIGGPPW